MSIPYISQETQINSKTNHMEWCIKQKNYPEISIHYSSITPWSSWIIAQNLCDIYIYVKYKWLITTTY
jgi:hypothetical protein